MPRSKRIKFIKTVYRPYTPFYSSLYQAAYQNKKIFKTFFKFNYSMPDMMTLDGFCYYPEYHLVGFGDKVLKRLKESRGYWEGLKKETLKRERNLNKAVKKDLPRFLKAFQEYMPTLAIYFILDDRIESLVNGLILNKADSAKTAELMAKLNVPLLDNFDKKGKLLLLQTCDPRQYIKQYGWQGSRYGHLNEFPLERAVQLLKELKRDNYLKKSNLEKDSIRKAVKEAKQLVGSDKAYLIDVMQFFIYYRTQRTDIMNKVAYQYAPKLKKLASDKGITYNDLIYCSYLEVVKNKIPDLKVIRQRQAGFTTATSPESLKIYSGLAHKKLVARYNNFQNVTTKEIKGRSAYGGKVCGQVQIINNKADLAKVQTGNILITYMTTTEMIQAMKKAAAFVTDEGGITCHAAILAREMKKPCIIGTKNATKIFKNGDRVEVNAESGTVRVIK